MYFVIADTSNVTLNVGLITAIVGILTITGAVFAFIRYIIKSESKTQSEKIAVIEKENAEETEDRKNQHTEVMTAINNIGEAINKLTINHNSLEGKLDTLKTELTSTVHSTKTETLRDVDRQTHELETKLRMEFNAELDKLKDKVSDLSGKVNS